MVGVLVVLRTYAFRGLIDHGDVQTFWLPTYCFLGKTLAGGHIPGWNPFVFGGAPFAADPQSGWLYGPPMALFSLLRCDVAIRTLLVFQPMMAGFSLYWFLKSEGLSRISATTGGCVFALTIAGSGLATSIPVAGTLAWTAFTLAACSRCLRASAWPARLVWLGVTALGWGQIAGAFLTDGLALGTAALALYGLFKLIHIVRAGTLRPGQAVAIGGLLLLALPAVNLAILLPRIEYLRETTFRVGYGGLLDLSHQLGRNASARLFGEGTGLGWPLKLSTSPGAHLGALALALAPAALWAKRNRAVVLAFAAFSLSCYVLSLDLVARAVPHVLRSINLIEVYLHAPHRLGDGVVLGMAVMAAFGLEAWGKEHRVRTRILMLVPGCLIWWFLPLIFGAGAGIALVGVGAVLGIALLRAAMRRPAWLAGVPLLLAVELTVSPSLGVGPALFRPPALLGALPKPETNAAGYVRPGPLVRALRDDGEERYLAVGSPFTVSPAQDIPGAGFLNQAMLFGTLNVGGYNPAQLLRVWVFDRALEGGVTIYQFATFLQSTPLLLNLFQVGFVATPAGSQPPPGMMPIAHQADWTLYRSTGAVPRASVIPVGTGFAPRGGSEDGGIVVDPALRKVTAGQFDPSTQVVLDGATQLQAAGSAEAKGTATYRTLSNESAVVVVSASQPSLVLVRNPFEAHWHASVDGRRSELLRADYVLQAVAVPPGRHVVRLTYRDPWIGYGAAGSLTALLGLAGWIILASMGRKRRLGLGRARPLESTPVGSPSLAEGGGLENR